MDTTAIYIIMQRILKQLLGLPDSYIRMSNQNSPATASTSYATISVLSTKSKSRKNSKFTSNPPDANPAIPTDFTEEISQNAIEVILLIKFYGNGCDKFAGDIPLLMQSEHARGLLKIYNIGYSGCNQLTIDDALFNDTFQPFTALEMKIYASNSVTLTVNEMNKFEVSGSVDDLPINVTLP